LFIIELIKTFSFTCLACLIYLKIGNTRKITCEQILKISLFTIVPAVALALLSAQVIEPIKSILVVFAVSGVISIIKKTKLLSNVFYITVSYIFSLVFWIVSTFISSVIFVILFGTQKINVWFLILVFAIETLIVFAFYRTKFKFMINYNKNIASAGTAITGISLIVYSLFRETELQTNNFILLFSGIILCGLGLYRWLKKESISTYNEKAQKLIISKKDKKIEELNNTRLELEKTIHTDSKKLPAYREAIKSFIVHIENPVEKKKAAELYKALRVAQENLAWETSRYDMPSTELVLLDSIFQYYHNVALKNGISFRMSIGGAINNIIKIITQSQIETLVSNLLDNAVNAIKKVGDIGNEKHITVRLWDSGLSIEDNGAAFNSSLADLEICKETLSPNRKSGVGIGFVTIFEIANECGASVEITENNGFKIITIRFDGENRIEYNKTQEFVNI